jgi:divalent metal cation (Fe/Co/Zn/Cd) transporter
MEEDRFGFKKMTTDQEVVISFTLFLLGNLLLVSSFLPLIGVVDLAPAILGTIMIGTGYLFAVESVRELEEKDHFLARKLAKKTEE